jgi:hypothetical protein
MRPRPLVRTLVLLTAIAAVAAGGAACSGDLAPGPATGGGPTSGTEVSGDGWRGVLLGSGVDHLQRPGGEVVDADSFVPTEDDVRRFEEQVPDLLPTADGGSNPSGEPVTEDDLATHVRQYTGVEGGGERHLVIAGICEGAADGLDWRAGWITVSDGGTCYWDAAMDLATGEVLRFSFHGPA